MKKIIIVITIIFTALFLTSCSKENSQSEMEKATFIASEFVKKYESNYYNLTVDDVSHFFSDSKMSNVNTLIEKVKIDRQYILDYTVENSLTDDKLLRVENVELNSAEKIILEDGNTNTDMYTFTYKVNYNTAFITHIKETSTKWNNIIKVYTIKVLNHYKIAYFEYVSENYGPNEKLSFNNIDSPNIQAQQKYSNTLTQCLISICNLAEYNYVSNTVASQVAMLQQEHMIDSDVEITLENAVYANALYNININTVPIIESWDLGYNLAGYRSFIQNGDFEYSIEKYSVGENMFEIVSIFSNTEYYIVSVVKM